MATIPSSIYPDQKGISAPNFNLIELTPIIAVSSTSATPGNANDICRPDGPSWPSPWNRGIIANTSIDQTNKNVSHSCDFILDLKQSILLKKFLKAMAKTIREGIRALQKLLGIGDPSGTYSEQIATLKGYAADIKYINDEYIKPITLFEKFVIGTIALLKDIVQWILSLPAAILAILKDCLKKLLETIGNMFKDAWKDSAEPTGDEGGWADVKKAWKEVYTAGKDALKGAKEVITNATTIVNTDILIPTTDADNAAAANAATVIVNSVSKEGTTIASSGITTSDNSTSV
jgi:hypothetical protein